MRRNTLFYSIAIVLLLLIILFLNKTYNEVTNYSQLTNRNNSVRSYFQSLSTQINKAAVQNPDIVQNTDSSTYSKLFFIDSAKIIQHLQYLKATARDSINIQITNQLSTLINAEISWLFKSNVPDSIRHHKAAVHIASFRAIDSLLSRGIERTNFLIEGEKAQLSKEIKKIRLWMIFFITLSGVLLVYTMFSFFKQRFKTITKERELETVLNRIDDGVVSLDNEWRYTFLNDAALITHPMGKEKTLGKFIWEIHPELKGTVFWEKYREAMLTRKVVEIESYYEPMDRWFSVRAYPSADGLTIFYRDVTEGKKAEQDLLQTLKEVNDYKFALDESSIVAITDQKGIIKHANQNFCKISKYTAEELIGQDHRIINSGYHSKEFIKNIWTTIANGKIWKGELRNKAKDGTIYWVDTTIVPFLTKEGKPYQYVAIRADITERKLAEENLRASLKEIADYKYALDESSIVAITDQKGIIKYANENFCKISKYTVEELIGQDHRIINSGYHPREFIRDLWTTIANGKIWKGELKNRAKDGTIYWVDTTIVPFLDEKGKPYQYVAIRSDITERKQAEEKIIDLNIDLEKKIKERTQQLKKSNEEMEAFTYSVSHDLRAPLRGIIGFTAILEEDYATQLDDEAKRITSVIRYNTLKMGRLIDDLLGFSRMGRHDILKTRIDIQVMVEEVIEELRPKNKEIKWTVQPLPKVNGDINTIRQVWINLISNAIKYSGNKDKQCIQIGFFDKGSQFVFYVRDNGVGFDEKYQEKLFKVFQRLHGSEEFEGTGVGLALVEKIISKHGGKVWAEGKVGEGACFYFSLPA